MENAIYYSNPDSEKRKYMNVAEKIGNEYKEWKAGDEIFITASTGSGKSYFILHMLLEWAAQNKKKVLYFVNRKVLQEQLKAEVKASCIL